MTRDIDLARRFFTKLLETETLEPDALNRYQEQILERTVRHAYETVPFYRQRLAPLFDGHGEIDFSRWHTIPLLDRDHVIEHWDELQTTRLPDNHGLVKSVQTGGSTGTPLTVQVSELENLARITATYRTFAWHAFDCSQPLAMIRKPQAFQAPDGSVPARKWGFPWRSADALGDRLFLDVATDPADQLAWLRQHAPAYINTLPSNILALVLASGSDGPGFPLRAVLSVAELLTDDVRESCRANFGCAVIDALSSAEGGFMAVQCPVSGQYHVQSELVRLEVLGEDGSPCAPGEMGELVVTPLYNFAMPFIRYRQGDFVVAGERCTCHRGLPTLAGVIGRSQHLFRYADGTRRVPPLPRERISRLLGTRFWQVVQVATGSAELRHAGTARPDGGEALALVGRALAPEFSVVERRDGSMLPPSGAKWHYAVNALVT